MPRILIFIFFILIVPSCIAQRQQKFWTVERFSVTSILAGEIAFDGYVAQNALQYGAKENNPIARPFETHGTIGQATISILGIVSVLGAQYIAHRAHHERIADWLGRIVVIGEGINDISQGINNANGWNTCAVINVQGKCLKWNP